MRLFLRRSQSSIGSACAQALNIFRCAAVSLSAYASDMYSQILAASPCTWMRGSASRGLPPISKSHVPYFQGSPATKPNGRLLRSPLSSPTEGVRLCRSASMRLNVLSMRAQHWRPLNGLPAELTHCFARFANTRACVRSSRPERRAPTQELCPALYSCEQDSRSASDRSFLQTSCCSA